MQLRVPDRVRRIAVVASHPIQYQAPFFRELAAEEAIELKVYFCSDAGAAIYWDNEFEQEVRWDTPLLEGYEWEILDNKSIRPALDRFFGVWCPAIVKKLRQGNYDALMVHGWANATNWLAMLTAFYLRIPVLMRAETSALQQTTGIRAVLKPLILRALFRRIAAFLAIGTHGAAFYERLGICARRVFVLPYAVDNELFMKLALQHAAMRDKYRAQIGISPDIPVILFSGKLIPRKRPADLLKAFEIVRANHRAALVFVGDGSLGAELQQYAAERSIKDVHFVGFQNQNQMCRYYASADLFVLPSAFETWGMVVNEAMCFSLPCVVSSGVSAAADVVIDGENGFVYPSGDVQRLAMRIETLVSHPAIRVSMGGRALSRIGTWSFDEDLRQFRRCLEFLGGTLESAALAKA